MDTTSMRRHEPYEFASDIPAVLGALQRQHDETVSRLYRGWTRDDSRLDMIEFATDPELVFHLEASECIGAYLEDK
jgi:hypothetical protein